MFRKARERGSSDIKKEAPPAPEDEIDEQIKNLPMPVPKKKEHPTSSSLQDIIGIINEDVDEVNISQTQAWLIYEIIYKQSRKANKRKNWYIKKIKEALE